METDIIPRFTQGTPTEYFHKSLKTQDWIPFPHLESVLIQCLAVVTPFLPKRIVQKNNRKYQAPSSIVNNLTPYPYNSGHQTVEDIIKWLDKSIKYKSNNMNLKPVYLLNCIQRCSNRIFPQESDNAGLDLIPPYRISIDPTSTASLL